MNGTKVRIIEADLPEGIRGLTAQPKGGDCIVMISTGTDKDRQAAAFLHECLHIWQGMHGEIDGKTVDQIETDTRRDLRRILQYLIDEEAEGDRPAPSTENEPYAETEY